MKAYLFNAENGLYQGETFEQADMLVNEDGITTIPPPHYEQGQVPVFDTLKREWNLMDVSLVRRLFAGRDST